MKKKVELLSIALGAFLLFLLNPVFAAPFDSIVVKVRNKAVTKNEIELKIEQRKQERAFMRMPEIGDDEVKKEVVYKLVNDLLLLARAEELNLSTSPKEIKDRIDSYKSSNGLNDTTFEQTLNNMNFTLKQFNKLQSDNILMQKVISKEVYGNIDISAEQVRKAYEAENQGQIYKIRQLLRQTPLGATEEQEEKAKQEIVYLAEQLEKGESFEQLILDYSEDPNARENKGILEFELENAIEPLKNAISDMKVGDFKSPIKTQFGYHLIQLMEIKEAEKKPYDEVKDQYRDALFQQAYQDKIEEVLEGLRKRLKIVFFDESLEKYYAL